jgi:hypothetical protein
VVEREHPVLNFTKITRDNRLKTSNLHVVEREHPMLNFTKITRDNRQREKQTHNKYTH